MSRRGGKLATILLAGALCAPAMATQHDTYAAAGIADCNGSNWQTILAPARNAPRDARAYWLDRRLIQWPGAPMRGHFKLYHAAAASLDVRIGEHIDGADGALALATFDGTLATTIAERFRFITGGLRLALQAQDVARLPQLLDEQVVLVREDDRGRVLDATMLQLPGALDDLYSDAAAPAWLGVHVEGNATQFGLWAPTARAVSLCRHDSAESDAAALDTAQRDPHTGAWSRAP